MEKATTKIAISDIVLDESIYPRDRIDQKRVGIFAANIRDGFTFDPLEVEAVPERPGRYRILDGLTGGAPTRQQVSQRQTSS